MSIPQPKEGQDFLSRLAASPKTYAALTEVLKPSLEDESALRKLFATNRDDVRLQDIHVGLVDVFGPETDVIRTVRERAVNDAERDREHVMLLDDAKRRKDGQPAMVHDLEEFKKSWNIFSEGSLSQLTDWNNIVVAGGSALACLLPLPESALASKRAIRKFFHEQGQLYTLSSKSFYPRPQPILRRM